MNEEAIQDSYNVFVSQGYNKSIDEYKKLIATNPNALNDSYNAFKGQGYNKSIDEYKKLMGVGSQSVAPVQKKKFALESSSEDGSLVSQKSPKVEKTALPKLVGSDKKIAKALGTINTDLMNQTEEDVVAQLSKDQTLKDLGFTFEEAGWTGDYMKVVAPNGKTTEISLDNFLNSKSSKQSLSLQNFIKNNITKEKRAELDKFVALEESDEKKFQSEKKKYGDIFDKQLSIKPKAEESQYLKDRLASINTELINKEEEFVVPELEYQFGDLGFKFEESGATGDYVKVTAPNGKTTEISLDNFLSSKSKTQSDLLQNFIKQNAPAKGLFVLEKTMREQDKKFNSEKQVDESIKGITNEVTALNAKQKQFLLKKSSFEAALKMWSSSTDKNTIDSLEQQRLALNEEMKSILEEEETIKQKSKRLDAAVGKYSIAKSKQGGWIGGIQDAITRGIGKMSSGFTNMTIDFMAETRPNEEMVAPDELKKQTLIAAKKLNIKGPSENQKYEQWKASLTEDNKDNIEDEIDDYVKKSMKADLLPYIRIGSEEIFGDPETTKQWSDLKKEGFWGGAFLGVAESLPAMIGGAGPAGWAQRTAQMYAQISDGLTEEMEKDPDFKNISENEKLAITLPIGITSAALEAYGLRNIMASKGVISSLTMRALGKAGRATSAKTFRELVENEVESALARGLLTITAAGVAEFETGALQEASETGFKVLYDEIKGKDMFNTPDSKLDLIENIVVAGAQEAVGGFVLGVPTGVSAAYSEKGFLKMDDISFETFASMANDEKMQSAYIASLKEKITQGAITEKEAKDQLNNYRNSVGLYRQLPDGLDTRQKKEAMNLLKEKKDLENFVEGKDAALVVKQKNRIAEINNELTKLSETDAVQEQSTTEVPVQSETITSETLETGVSQPGPEVVTEQGTQEVAPSETITTAQEENKIESVRSNFENGNLQNIEINPTRQGFEGDFLNDYEFLAEGSEHTVYRSKDGKTVIKIGEPYASNEGFMPRVEDALRINNLIGDNSLEVIGYYENNGVKNPIYQQNYIDGKTMTQEEVASHLESKGFVNLGNNKFAITVDGKTYEISDTSDNFIIDNQGNVSAIDAGIMELDINKLTEEQKSKLKETTAQEEVVGIPDEVSQPIELSVTPEVVTEQTTQEVTPTEQVVEAEAAPVVEEATPAEDLNELLTLDTKDETNLKRIYDYLDNLDSALDLDSNELNDVTRVMAIGTAKAVVKTLKALVKAGITLQEAINTAAEVHSVKTEDVLKAFQVIKQGGKQKSAPSPVKNDIYLGAGRLISVVKDIKKITMSEKALLVKQIRDKITGAKDVIKTTKEISQQLVKDIKELESTGKITPTQALNMISKFNKVNMLNEVSVSNFIDYMSKVFADADYDNKINVAKGKLKAAKKNINTKIGIADGLVGPLQKLFAINPELIPEPYLEKYLELVDMFGARQAVLNLEEKSKVTKDVIEILNEINNERSAVDELSERFNYSENQVIENGKINYAATVKNMLKEGEITEEESALMTKYKSEIGPKVKREERTEEEIQEEKDQLLAEVKKSTINADDLPTRTERDAAKKLATLIKSPGVKELSNAQLKNLLKVIDNINNGYFAHSAHLIIEEINSINNSKVLESSVNKAKLLPLSKLYSQAKSILTRKDAVLEMIRRNPLFNIDQVLGDFKTKDVFNSILEKAAEGEAKFTAELKAIQSKLSNAEEKIAKSFKLDPNKTIMSKFKIMTYMVQLEYESNPDSKQVNPASKFIEATINHINEGKSQFEEKDAEMLQEILDNYTDDDGNIDVKKLYNSFNSAEKSGIKTIQEVNQSLKEKAEYTASVIRGQRINPLSNYIHLNVLSDTKPNDLTSGESFADQYNNSLKPSTKAKSLIERTGKVSPLNFDVFASAQKGAKSVLMDFHLTEPIRTGRKTINKTITSLGKIDKEKRRIINTINKSFEESVENLVNNSYMETSVGDDVADYIKKQGYRSVLAGTGRFAAEFLSNVGFVIISDPITFAEGLKYTSILMSPDAPSIMHNVNSKEINRIFPSDTLSGRLIDTNILSEANGIKGGKAKNRVINKAQQIWNLTGKKYKNAVELTADVLITTPDKAIMRPIWFGSFATNFKKETGKDVDFEKIAANDEAYISENKEAIDKSRDAADERSVITGASNNAFTGILKGTSKPNQSNFIKGFNNFNNFMSRFLIYEYTSARTGIMAAMGNGSLSRKEGIALLGAVTTRMTVYSLLAKALGGGLIGLLFGDDDEEDEKSLDKSIGQALTSTFTSLLFNRDFGNATKSIINYGLERINENYLQALREGDYDPYKDAIQYSTIPMEKKGKQTGVYDYVESAAGAYGPAIKTTNLIIKTYSEEDKKEADAIQRQKDVKNIRIPLEVLGNAGFIPLYKDIRKEVMKEIYKGIEKGPSAKKRRVMSQEEYDRLTK